MPDVLESVLEIVERVPRLDPFAPWARYKDLWFLGVKARLSIQANEHVPAETNWFLVFSPLDASVSIYPAKAGGITKTFRHQSFNSDGSPLLPWRDGNPCLDRRALVFGRASWVDQPPEIVEKIGWHLQRLLVWIDAAASDTLAVTGEQFELPTGPGQASFPLIGFVGAPEDLAFWAARKNEWGWADLVQIPQSSSTYAVKSFRDSARVQILEAQWGSMISSVRPSRTAIWIALESLPVTSPWELPRTWSELQCNLAFSGVDLQSILLEAGASQRRDAEVSGGLTLLLGFPISSIIGDPPTRFHWLAVDGIPVAGSSSKRNGFRQVEKSRRLLDIMQTKSGLALKWLRCSNWESSELRTRRGKDHEVPANRVLIIGAGSLGSAISENMVRMGMTKLGILDADLMDVGNLTRHALGLEAVGHNKAAVLASALNATMPDADAVGFACGFPPADDGTLDRIRGFTVIVDCSGSDKVLDAMSGFDWGGEKIFVSLAVTWKAEGLLVYTASETRFPAIDAKERFGEFDTPPADFDEAHVEGIGCWHPVFPADASDMRLWSAIGTKAILRAIKTPGRRCEYFRQATDGTVERRDV